MYIGKPDVTKLGPYHLKAKFQAVKKAVLVTPQSTAVNANGQRIIGRYLSDQPACKYLHSGM
jgi:hypothetical protein